MASKSSLARYSRKLASGILGFLTVYTAKEAFVILTVAFVIRVATVDQNSPLWQPAVGSKTHMEYRKS